MAPSYVKASGYSDASLVSSSYGYSPAIAKTVVAPSYVKAAGYSDASLVSSSYTSVPAKTISYSTPIYGGVQTLASPVIAKVNIKWFEDNNESHLLCEFFIYFSCVLRYNQYTGKSFIIIRPVIKTLCVNLCFNNVSSLFFYFIKDWSWVRV